MRVTVKSSNEILRPRRSAYSVGVWKYLRSLVSSYHNTSIPPEFCAWPKVLSCMPAHRPGGEAGGFRRLIHAPLHYSPGVIGYRLVLNAATRDQDPAWIAP